MASFLLINNPTSGATEGPSSQELEAFFAQQGSNLTLLDLREEDCLNRAADLLKEEKYTAIVAAGGDGTVLAVSPLAIEHKLPLAILPTGSANGLAKELKLPKAWQKAGELSGDTQVMEMDVLYINDLLCLHLADVGLNAQLIEAFERDEQRGWLGYSKPFIQTLLNQEPFHVRVKMNDDISLEKEVVMVAFANAKTYGTGALLNPNGKIDDGKFEVILIPRLSTAHVAEATIRFFNGTFDQLGEVEIHSVEQLEVFLDEKRTWQSDGELLEPCEHFRVRVASRALKILMPATVNLAE